MTYEKECEDCRRAGRIYQAGGATVYPVIGLCKKHGLEYLAEQDERTYEVLSDDTKEGS